jgi:hypothetical protein
MWHMLIPLSKQMQPSLPQGISSSSNSYARSQASILVVCQRHSGQPFEAHLDQCQIWGILTVPNESVTTIRRGQDATININNLNHRMANHGLATFSCVNAKDGSHTGAICPECVNNVSIGRNDPGCVNYKSGTQHMGILAWRIRSCGGDKLYNSRFN